MARSTRLVILIKNIYTLWGRKRFLLPVTYFPTNLVYPFTLRVTGIISFDKHETGHKLDFKYTGPNKVESIVEKDNIVISNNKNKEERYSRVPRLSDTRYSAK